MDALGLRYCAGFSLAALCGLVTAVAPPVAERRLEGAEASVTAACHLWSMGLVVMAQELSSPWHVEPSQSRGRTCVPALAGGFLITGPPVTSLLFMFVSLATYVVQQ